MADHTGTLLGLICILTTKAALFVGTLAR